MRYIARVAVNWSRTVKPMYHDFAPVDFKEDADNLIQRMLNDVYPGMWMYKTSNGQYIHVDSKPGDDLLAVIEPDRNHFDQLCQEVDNLKSMVENYSAQLEARRVELMELLKSSKDK